MTQGNSESPGLGSRSGRDEKVAEEMGVTWVASVSSLLMAMSTCASSTSCPSWLFACRASSSLTAIRCSEHTRERRRRR